MTEQETTELTEIARRIYAGLKIIPKVEIRGSGILHDPEDDIYCRHRTLFSVRLHTERKLSEKELLMIENSLGGAPQQLFLFSSNEIKIARLL